MAQKIIAHETFSHGGKVALLRLDGSDDFIADAARVSTIGDPLAQTYTKEQNEKLLWYLWRNEHQSPFEMVETVWYMKLPISVARQFIRHRTASVNEASRRYKSTDPEYYFPRIFREKAENAIKQGSKDIGVDNQYAAEQAYEAAITEADRSYIALLEYNVAPEVARDVLPVSLFTEWFWKMDLRNLFHFLELRMDPHAQYEIREYAQSMFSILKNRVEIKGALTAFEKALAIKMKMKELVNIYKDDIDLLCMKLNDLTDVKDN